MKHDKLSIISGLLVFVIATLAFILSFDAIMQLAIANGVKTELAWIVPLIVDGAMAVFSVSVLRATLANEGIVWGWCLIVSFTAVSVAFNIAHSNLKPFGVVIAALAPLALFFSFETLMSQIRSTVQGGINALARHWRGRAMALLTIAKHWRQCARDWQREAASLQGASEAMTERLVNLQERVNDARLLQSELAKLRKENGRLQDELSTMQGVYEAWQHINETHRLAARYNAGEFGNLEEPASMAGVSPSTISRIAKSMNGAAK